MTFLALTAIKMADKVENKWENENSQSSLSHDCKHGVVVCCLHPPQIRMSIVQENKNESKECLARQFISISQFDFLFIGWSRDSLKFYFLRSLVTILDYKRWDSTSTLGWPHMKRLKINLSQLRKRLPVSKHIFLMVVLVTG